MLWIRDPANKENSPSVTLTLVIVSFAACLIGAGLEIAGVTKGTSILMEMFVGSLSCYLGRRINFSGKTGSSEPINQQGEGK